MQFGKEVENVSILFIARQPDGAIATTGFESGAPLFWNDKLLRDPTRRLGDIECRLIAVEGQIREKEETPGGSAAQLARRTLGLWMHCLA